MNNIPDPPPEPPDEKALAYLDYVSDTLARQVATARVRGQKVPTVLFLPPPPRPYDLQPIQSFIAYLFANEYKGDPSPKSASPAKSTIKFTKHRRSGAHAIPVQRRRPGGRGLQRRGRRLRVPRHRDRGAASVSAGLCRSVRRPCCRAEDQVWPQERGRRSARNGTKTQRQWFADYMELLGFKWVSTRATEQDCKVFLRDGELPAGGSLCRFTGTWRL